MFYAHIDNENNIIDFSEAKYLNFINVEVTEEQYNNAQQYGNNYYIYDNGELVLNPNYKDEQAQKKQERINNLTMTALDFIGVLEKFGLDYVTQIKPFLEAHQDLDKQLKYCQNVWCGVAKQIFAEPIKIGEITITSEMVEEAFKDKNGEN